jgi:hypothetical protein
MRKSTPQNLARTFKDRSMGMFRKAAQLHAIDGTVRISIVIEKPGQIPLVFSTDEVGFEWPNLTQQYVRTLYIVVLYCRLRCLRSTQGRHSPATREKTVPFR